MQEYQKIADKWLKRWQEEDPYIKGRGEKLYILVEFPYPSGNLHFGHWYSFTVPDILVRYKRMKGYNVFFPIGFDSFGLPAENAAIKNNIDPKEWTYNNIDYMKKQFLTMANSFDDPFQVITSNPDFYKWTQRGFKFLVEKKIAYKKKSFVNWCPGCNTVLANEQIIEGECERCQQDIIQKEQEQWFIGITKYADRLIDDLDTLNWSDEIKNSQKQWIGRSYGTIIPFTLSTNHSIETFTTRADTLYGVTYLVIAPEHSLVLDLMQHISNTTEVQNYRQQAIDMKDKVRNNNKREKTGVCLKGIHALHPITKTPIPIYIADYVVLHHGTGIVMGVPAHDTRDFLFAQKYNLDIKKVITSSKDNEEIEVKKGVLINSGIYDSLTSDEAIPKIIKDVEGRFESSYRLRDWSVSRQRYWGCPIPIVYDKEGVAHPIPNEHLPWHLPTDVDITPSGVAPLQKSKELKERVEKIFGEGWTPEYDTLDTFFDSSWYFIRYLDRENTTQFADKKKIDEWLPVDIYFGGAEHTTLHLLYSRFVYKFLYDYDLVPTKEPYTLRINRGIILGSDGNKMSKSKGNVFDLDAILQKVGIDAVRLYLGFIGPYNNADNYPCTIDGFIGMRRFVERVWKIEELVVDTHTDSDSINRIISQTIQKVEKDINDLKFNTAISQLMICANKIREEGIISKKAYSTYLTLLAPFCPVLTEELWERMKNSYSIHKEKWPIVEKKFLIKKEANIIIQIDGKKRGEVTVPYDSNKEIVEKESEYIIKKYTTFGTYSNIIFVPNRILNIVTIEK